MTSIPADRNGCMAAGGVPGSVTRAETEEETGFRVRQVRQVMDAFMSPGSVTERLHFFVGEDIAVLELRIDEALAMVAAGTIRDG